MKVYILLDESRGILAVYNKEDLAKKMKDVVKRKIGEEVTMEAHQINPDIKLVGRNR